MIEAIRGDMNRLGDAYHQLFMGHDTDDAEAAAQHMGQAIELIIQTLKAK